MGLNIIGTLEYQNILAGDFPRSTLPVVMAGGQKYPAGAIVGKVNADGKCTLVDNSKSDGTENVYGVLLHDVDATAGDVPGVIALTGEYNRNHLTFGGADTWETHFDAARKLCIFFKEPAS
ncbi:MAG: head decoration protein [Planctomycetaceae bacterium]|nr:head decoration protein [Planctomycetaceae bacterium]